MSITRKNTKQPDEVRTFEKGKLELVAVGGVTFGLATLEPGWKWSTCVKPIAKTDSCLSPHLQYQISGQLHIRMDNGSEMDCVAGDVMQIPPGHDAWVVGNEPVVLLDITGMKEYAKVNR